MPANFRPYKRKRTGSDSRSMKRQRTTKPSVTPAMVRKLVLSAQEMKHVDALVGTAAQGYYDASEVTQPTPVPFMYYDEGINQGPHNYGPSIVSGAGANQRVGNHCRLVRAVVKLQLYSLPNFEAVASYPSSVRVIIVQTDNTITNLNSIIDTTDFYTNTSPVLAHFRNNPTTPYRLLYDRTFSPGRVKGYDGGDGGALLPTYAVGGESYIIRKSIKIDRDITYGSNASKIPNHKSIAVFCFVDDDNVGFQTPTWRLRGTVRYHYKDA